ncbi:MAG: NUDIX domain-containing protein [Candidatus Methanofastidiosa archaeon]|nr:NUDIX domain-containing protein [Candidatus Methanofastidiosa archaeon]
MNCYLLRYSEIGLKSYQTRKRWLETLKRNVQKGLFWSDVEYSRLDIVQGRLILYSEDSNAEKVLEKVFGLVSFSPATETRADIGEIKDVALSIYDETRPGSFRVTSQRVTKEFCMTSIEINQCVGEAVYESGGKVDLRNFELNIGIEIIGDKAYTFYNTFRGPGGLPIGVQGTGCAIVRDFKDFASCLLFMKRGCMVDLIVLSSPMASTYIDILQGYAFEGLKILLIDKEWQIMPAMQRYLDAGIEIFVTAEPLESPENMVNLCPTELYTIEEARAALEECNLSDVPDPVNDYRISAGCVIYYNDTILLLRRKAEKTWVLPKGGVDGMEYFRDAAMREACEESGACNLDFKHYIGKSHYSSKDRHGQFTKDVYYYLCYSKKFEVALEYLFDSYTMLPAAEAIDLLTFENDKKIVRKAEKIRKAADRNV